MPPKQLWLRHGLCQTLYRGTGADEKRGNENGRGETKRKLLSLILSYNPAFWCSLIEHNGHLVLISVLNLFAFISSHSHLFSLLSPFFGMVLFPFFLSLHPVLNLLPPGYRMKAVAGRPHGKVEMTNLKCFFYCLFLFHLKGRNSLDYMWQREYAKIATLLPICWSYTMFWKTWVIPPKEYRREHFNILEQLGLWNWNQSRFF